MSKVILFALAMTLAGTTYAAPPSKATSTTGRATSNGTQTNNSASTTSAGASNAAPAQGNGNMVCPKVNGQQNAKQSKCFPRPTKTIQR